ncbi:ComEC/Rec2 family competence protein [Tropheryma whipplei]|uniref:ComEC/Rec2 family competence protein n=1 Tax=Tropheryma whipplei TaxID=2039 RepID=UPI0004AC77AF|nr:competence protein ComE [Tropheryma whipplei]
MKKYRLAIALSAVLSAIFVYFAAFTGGQNWVVAVCDVGQGDAVMIRSNSSIAMVDMGASEKLLDKCMKRFSVQRINLLVISHYDRDHVGGYKSVVGKVDRVLTGENDRRLASVIESTLVKGGASMSRVHKGDTGLLGQMKWEIIWPRRDNPPNLRRGNNGSVVIAFRGDKLSMIFLGDLGKPAQQLIFSDFTNTTHGVYDIVKVAHHGSSDQFPMLYKHISAKYGIISAGKRNRYGHPTKIALEILRKYGTQPLITSVSGYISISGNRDNFEIHKEHD